jgi:hypothetical protein
VSCPKVCPYVAADGTRLFRVSTATNSKKLYFTPAELRDLVKQANLALGGAVDHVRAT